MTEYPLAAEYFFPLHRRGSLLVLAAGVLVFVLAFVAFTVDLGYMALVKAQLQNGADAAALAGAEMLSSGPGQVRLAARDVAAANFAAGNSIQLVTSEDVELGLWDEKTATFTASSGTDESDANAVRVTCRLNQARGTQLQLFFAPVLNVNNGELRVTAVARAKASRCGMIIGLTKITMSGSSHTDSYKSSQGAYSAASASDNGDVCSNGPITMSGPSKVNGDAHPGPGYAVSNSGDSSVTGSKDPLQKKMEYPAVDPGDAATINDNATVPLSNFGKMPLNSNKEFTLSGGDGVTLFPGTYYWSKLTLSGGSTITITDKTIIYVTGDVSMSGGSVSNTTFKPINFQLYPMGAKCVISGSSECYGIVYGPTAKVERSGDSDYYGMIVGGELVLSGGGGIHADESIDLLNSSGASRAVLAQ